MFEVNQRVDPAAELPELAAAIAALSAPEPGGSAAAAGVRVRALLMLHRRLEGRLLGELASFDRQGFADGYGFPSTASWLRAVGYLNPAQATGMVATARTAEVLPLLSAELAAGRIGVEHVDAVSRSTRDVPDEDLAAHDKTLRDLTIWGRPHDLAEAGRKITEVYRHDLAEAEPDRVRGLRRLSVARTFDGLFHVDGLLPADVGAQLLAVTDPLATKRGPEDERTPTQRRADALGEICEMLLRFGELPDVGGESPRLSVVVSAAATAALGDTAASTREGSLSPDDADGAAAVVEVGDMLGRRGLFQAMVADGSVLASFSAGSAADLLGAGALRPATVARLACDAEFMLAVVDRGGDVLNLGRSSRFPNLAQRRALVVRDRGCVFPGCDRPPSGCQAHHLTWWSHDGPTDLDNLALVCHYHHHLVHEDRWLLERIGLGPEAPWGGWQARSPTGLELQEFRQPAA